MFMLIFLYCNYTNGWYFLFWVWHNYPNSSQCIVNLLHLLVRTLSFIAWKQQVEPVLKGHRLHGFGVNPIIPPRIFSASNQDAGREIQLTWLRRNKMHSFYRGFNHHFLHRSSQRLLDLSTHGNYGTRSTIISVHRLSLRLISWDLSSETQIKVILEGLPCDYESAGSIVSSKLELLDMDEIEAILLAHEVCIEKFNQEQIENASVNFKSNNLASFTPDATSLANLTHSFNNSQ